MEDNIRPLSSKLARALEGLGSGILILVEGPDDQAVFEELFFNRLGKVSFYPVGGNLEGKSLLNEALAKRPDITVFGICDRDFADDADVEARLHDPEEKLFLPTWFCIENYLLDPEAVRNVLRVWFSRKPPMATVDEITAQMMQACRQLKTMMAANWVLREGQQQEFGAGQNILTRDDVVDQIQKRIGCLKPDAKKRLSAKEVEIDKVLTDLEAAFTRISGKHLLNQLCVFTQTHGKKILPVHLFDSLLDWLKNNKEPHPHLQET